LNFCLFDSYSHQWCQLKKRKENLARLMKNMKQYQEDYVADHPDDPLPENMRVLTDSDIERVHNAETFEEFQDVYQHFLLYFHNHLQPMQDYKILKKKEYLAEKRRERDIRREERLARRKTKVVTVTKTVTDEETGEEKEVEVEEEVLATDDEAEEEEPEEEIEDDPEDQENCRMPLRRDPYNVCRRAGLS
jgi:transcription elongation factor SPT6